MKIIKIVKILLFQYVLFGHLYAQDVQFSQLFADKLYLNPAYAGTDYCPRLALCYRNQWPGVQQPYVTYSASVDKYFPSISGGLGFRVMNDKQGNGFFNQFNADLIYSYYAKFSDKTLIRFALEASVYQKTVNARNIVFPNMLEPVQGVVNPNTEVITNQNFLSPDFSMGVLFNYKRAFVGVSGSHIPIEIVANHSEYLPLKITAHTGIAIPVGATDMRRKKMVLEPNFVYINQQNMHMLYYGIYFDVENMSLGAFYRQNLVFHFDAMVLSYHLKINNLILAYSFDAQLSRNIRHTMGTHEVSIGYIFPCSEKIREYNTISCPSF